MFTNLERLRRPDLCSVQIAGLELSQDDFLALVQKNPAGNEERLPSKQTYFTPPLDVITGLGGHSLGP